MKQRVPTRWLRKLSATFIAIGIVGLISWSALLHQYYAALPRTPDAATGHIYALNYHGIAIYETRPEKLKADILIGASLVFEVAGILVGLFEEKHWRRNSGKGIPRMPRSWRPK